LTNIKNELIDSNFSGYQYLDAEQLIKHIIGLKRNNENCLLYLWYDICGIDGLNHRNEIENFKNIVEKDSINFHHITYQDAIKTLKEEFYYGNEKYIDYLTDRYICPMMSNSLCEFKQKTDSSLFVIVSLTENKRLKQALSEQNIIVPKSIEKLTITGKIKKEDFEYLGRKLMSNITTTLKEKMVYNQRTERWEQKQEKDIVFHKKTLIIRELDLGDAEIEDNIINERVFYKCNDSNISYRYEEDIDDSNSIIIPDSVMK